MTLVSTVAVVLVTMLKAISLTLVALGLALFVLPMLRSLIVVAMRKLGKKEDDRISSRLGTGNSRRRFIPALVIAGVIGGGAISQAQIVCTIPCPIWDITAEIQHIAQLVAQQAANATLLEQNATLERMLLRATKWTDLAKHAISLDITPEWRIHDWWTDAVLTAQPFNYALTYGDRSGAGLEAVTEPRVDEGDALDGLSDDVKTYFRKEQAGLEVMDSVLANGADTAGTTRYGSRAETLALDIIQQDVTQPDADDEASATKVLGTISAEKNVLLHDGQVKLQIKRGILEQLVLHEALDRNEDATVMNMRLNALRANGAMDRSLMQDDTLSTWSQP